MNTLRYWVGQACAVGAALVCTLIGLAMTPRFDTVNIAMVYLLAVVVIALFFSRGAAILSAVLCVLILELLANTELVRSALLASISHDLRTPLAVMTGASSTLAECGDRMSGTKRTALAQSVYRQARGMAGQVSKILQMTRLEASGMEPDCDWASIQEIAGSAMARLQERLAGHRVVVDIPPDLPLLRIDAALIEQALVNLLENAARHTPPGTLIQIRAKRLGNQLVITVEDFGPGIDVQDLDRLFAKFERGRPDSGGVGLGLAICRAIMRLHTGNAWADNLSEGSIAFHHSLPLPIAPPAPDPEAH